MALVTASSAAAFTSLRTLVRGRENVAEKRLFSETHLYNDLINSNY